MPAWRFGRIARDVSFDLFVQGQVAISCGCLTTSKAFGLGGRAVKDRRSYLPTHGAMMGTTWIEIRGCSIRAHMNQRHSGLTVKNL